MGQVRVIAKERARHSGIIEADDVSQSDLVCIIDINLT